MVVLGLIGWALGIDPCSDQRRGHPHGGGNQSSAAQPRAPGYASDRTPATGRVVAASNSTEVQWKIFSRGRSDTARRS
jgi:hypothetical protein